MNYCFKTLGCKLNFAESSSLCRQLSENGMQRVERDADVVVLNTCSVTDVADHKSRLAINRLKRENPNATIIVTGCYAQLQPHQIAQIQGVDYVLGTDEKYQIPSLIHNLQSNEHIHVSDVRQHDFHSSYSRDDRTRCFVKVQDGCDYFCTYCTIPFARGRSRNADVKSTVAVITQALSEGAKEIVLTGVNIGDFGKSTNEHLIDLIRIIEALPHDFRVRISSCEPNLLTDDIIDFVAQSKHFAPHFHIPLQSGSDNVLKIMQRRYDTALFRERIEHIKRVMPNAFIGVDCMVGVRGETADDFREYYDFLCSLPVQELHVFPYSERAGTRMLRMDLPAVSDKVRAERATALRILSEQKKHQFYLSQVGNQATVLWEAKREKGMMAGWTENYVRQLREYDKNKVNTFEQITIQPF